VAVEGACPPSVTEPDIDHVDVSAGEDPDDAAGAFHGPECRRLVHLRTVDIFEYSSYDDRTVAK
jgi:hypothetical protein